MKPEAIVRKALNLSLVCTLVVMMGSVCSAQEKEKPMSIPAFINMMKKKAPETFLEVSRGGTSTVKTYSFPKGTAELTIIRGGAIEKASILYLQLKGIKPQGFDSKADGIVFQMEIFPKNPFCPMGHFNTQWQRTDETEYHTNLDLFPALADREDLDAVRKTMDAVAARFGKDKNGLREGLDVHYNMDHWHSPLAAKAGFKLKALTEKDRDLFITSYQTFFDVYVDLLRKTNEAPFTVKEETLKLKRNAKWLEYITLKDRSFKLSQTLGIPPEALVGFSFPPVAVFE
jgi:coproporphyrinogen III oxidase